MTNIYTKLHQRFILLVSALLFPGQKLFAQGPPGPDGGPPGPDGGPPGTGFLNIKWKNPLNVTTADGLVTIILNTLITIATPIIVVMIIYAGFLYVTARGNTEQVQNASKALTYAVIGGILVIGAVAITGIISETIGEFTS